MVEVVPRELGRNGVVVGHAVGIDAKLG